MQEPKVQEVKVPLSSEEVMKKIRIWSVGVMYNQNWTEPQLNLVKELLYYQLNPVIPPARFIHRCRPETWTAEVWRKVYHLPKAHPDGYSVKSKVSFAQLQNKNLVSVSKRTSKSIMKDQIAGTDPFREFCRILNLIFHPDSEEYHIYVRFGEMGVVNMEVISLAIPTPKKTRKFVPSGRETETNEGVLGSIKVKHTSDTAARGVLRLEELVLHSSLE
ncbi:hypothetical protein R1sor_002059 [Riccia sorocarpa]|uniref:Uncharacterized protein n=1 Tax=Riccia sorocarpa TaxID=122646 RepID=A0ABD3H0T8_9MARC